LRKSKESLGLISKACTLIICSTCAAGSSCGSPNNWTKGGGGVREWVSGSYTVAFGSFFPSWAAFFDLSKRMSLVFIQLEAGCYGEEADRKTVEIGWDWAVLGM